MANGITVILFDAAGVPCDSLATNRPTNTWTWRKTADTRWEWQQRSVTDDFDADNMSFNGAPSIFVVSSTVS